MNKSTIKKSIITLAALGAIAGDASAQSSVTVYGKIDLGLVVDDGPAGHSVRLSSGVSGGSRLGFKGVEDLGGGYKAAFQIETGFCADSAAGAPNFCTGSNQFMGRHAHGDLSGPFGTIVAGRTFSLEYLALANMDPFGGGYAGQLNNSDGKGNYTVDPAGVRINNSVTYTTPTFAGFAAAGELALGEQTGDWRKSRQAGTVLSYSKGPAYAALTYYGLNNSNGIGNAKRDFTAGGTYDFGAVKLHAMVQKVNGSPIGVEKIDYVSMMGGVTVPMAGGNLVGSYIQHNDHTAADQDVHQWGLGYVYPLSKLTSVYTAFARMINSHGSALTIGNATDVGTGNQAFNLGVVHNF